MADFTIRGAGIFGLSVAWALVRRGARVQIIDPHGIGAGSSGGLVGALAPHTPENWNAKKAFQFHSLIMAEDYWREVAEVSGMDPGYARTGRLQPVMDERGLELAMQRVGGAEEHWQGKAEWLVMPADDAGEWVPQSPTGWVIFDTLTARLHPRQACTALAAAVVARGGRIVTEGAAEGPTLWATGWQGLLELSDKLGRAVGNGVKGQAALLRFAAWQAPQLFVDGVHIVPHGDGTVAIGSTSEREFETPDGTDAALDDVVAKARAACDVMRDAPVIERWAGVRPRARSRAPMLGAHPVIAGDYIANGGFKIGFGMAPKVGEVMADLMLDGRDAIPDAFRVDASL